MAFKLMDIIEFKDYINNLIVCRKIKRIQLHHTYSPNYKHFNGSNHIKLQENMKNYHVKTNGWNDIGQHFTIFPDGKICTGRDISVAPAGIKGANTGAICIECLGNFDKGGDNMTEIQKKAIVGAVKILLDKFRLNAEDGVTYHAWWSADGREIGDYVKGHSLKTCPGTNFFGGNTLTAYENNLMSLIKNYEEKASSKTKEISSFIVKLKETGVLSSEQLWIKKCTEDNNIYWLCKKMSSKVGLEPIKDINTIIDTLFNAGILTDRGLWAEMCESDNDVYWLCKKMANKLRGTLE